MKKFFLLPVLLLVACGQGTSTNEAAAVDDSIVLLQDTNLV